MTAKHAKYAKACVAVKWMCLEDEIEPRDDDDDNP